MEWIKYYWRWFKTAFSFRRSFYMADAVAGAISIFSPPIILWLVPEPTSEDAAKMVTALAWQIPLVVLGVLTAGRVLLAPYWIHKDDMGNAAKSEAALVQRNKAVGARLILQEAKKSFLGILIQQRRQMMTLFERRLANEEDLEQLKGEMLTIAQETYNIVNQISPSDAERINSGIYNPNARVWANKFNDEHNILLNRLSRRVEVLDEVIKGLGN